MHGRLAAVVLNFRTPAATQAAVAALRTSARKPDAIYVVDNGSGDGSAEALAALPGILFLGLPKNLGYSGGCNAGIRRALEEGADLVALVNSDARVEPGCLGAIEVALEGHPEVGIAGPLVVHADSPQTIDLYGLSYSLRSGRMTVLGRGQHRAALALAERTEVDGVAGAVMVVRREVLQQVGLFAEEFFFSFEDLDLCLRARRAGFRTVCVGTAVALHEGAHTIGLASPRRLYFAARNHLLLAQRAEPASLLRSTLRGGAIAAFNLAHALLTSEAPRISGVSAVASGVRDHLLGRYGAGPGP